MPSISLPVAGIGAAIGSISPVVAAGAIGAAGAVGGALISSNAASSAADKQAQASQNALTTQVSGENAALASEAPYTQIGTGAANQLANLYGIAYGPSGSATPTTSATGVVTPGNVNAAVGSPGGQGVMNAAMANFTNTPDYNFAFQQGLQALDRSAAANGKLQSGDQVKGAQQFGQGLASQQFGNYYNRLLSLAQIGQGAASGQAANSLNAANAQGNTQQAIGQAQASGIVGSANALSSGLTGIGSSVTSSLLLSRLGLGGSSGSANLSSAYGGSSGLSEADMLNASNPYGNVTDPTSFASLAGG